LHTKGQLRILPSTHSEPTANNPRYIASSDEPARCLFTIELNKKSWVVGVNTPMSDKLEASCRARVLADREVGTAVDEALAYPTSKPTSCSQTWHPGATCSDLERSHIRDHALY
jgi:hypothetical protein